MSIQTYAARFVWPGNNAEPITNGEIVVEDGIILAVREQKTPASHTQNFGNSAILPGLVNAHTHLEYTALRGFLEDVPFFPWIRALTTIKGHLNTDDWTISAELGALETVAGGVTTIGDNTDAGVVLNVAKRAGLRGVVFQEVFGIDDREPVLPIMDALRAKVNTLQGQTNEKLSVGVSPHAPYTVRPALFEALHKYTQAEGLRTSIHVAESEAETELILTGSGPFMGMYERRGIHWNAPYISPTQYVANLGALNDKTLAVHCVHQNNDDIQTLISTGAAIVHCPKSNSKLGAGVALLTEWLTHKELVVALGTDSAVSNNALDMWEEMRFALLLQRAAHKSADCVRAVDVLKMATLGGAKALGLENITGTLEIGKQADFIAVRLDTPHASPADNLFAALVYSVKASDVLFTVCGGDVLFHKGEWKTLDKDAVFAAAHAVRRKIR